MGGFFGGRGGSGLEVGGGGVWMKINLRILDLQRLASLYFVQGCLQTISYTVYVKLQIPFLCTTEKKLCEVHGLSLILYSLFFVALRGTVFFKEIRSEFSN